MDIFEKELIRINHLALDKKSCLQEMAELLSDKEIITSLKGFMQAILERENLMSTGIGHGVAIPHARSPWVDQLKVVLFILRDDLDFASIDGEPVRIIFMIAVPENRKQEYIKLLSNISNFCKELANRDFLLNSNNIEEIYQILTGISG
ncbi:MAG: PTS sugar transporter subunit IIA [Candidatus Cloacimonetes bacterium]|nr:PTS sugar transporter subunit IIA [Candidatus Cloacimonadota bacterium]